MGINPSKFFNLLTNNNVDFFTGVPDSLLKQFCICIDENVSKDKHIISVNEGNAIALAAGYHLGTGKLGLVYMQNSGIGNAVNPLLSLTDQEVYSIPMLLLIGWRGEPGVKDEPQHIKQGRVLLELLQSIDVNYNIISGDNYNWIKKVENGISNSIHNNRPFAFVIKNDTFDKYDAKEIENNSDLMYREDALKIILESIPKDSVIVSTTGKTSREIFEIREQNNESHNTDFLTVGSMGHCSSIALGIAITRPEKKVICIDGDGSLLMHMGSLATIGKVRPNNFYHILMNNFVHESVGGQKTAIDHVDVKNLFKSINYRETTSIQNDSELNDILNQFFQTTGPNFMEVLLKPGSRSDLGRPTIEPIKNKQSLMDLLNN